MAISAEQAQARLDAYLAAEEKILTGQSVVMDGRTLTRANLSDVQQGIALWEGRLAKAQSGGRIQVREVIPR